MPNDQLSKTEVDMLFATEGAKMESLVKLARFELHYRQQKAVLIAAAVRAEGRQVQMVNEIVKAHGFDPDLFEADIEQRCIVPTGSSLFSMTGVSNSDAEMETRRGSAVKLRTVERIDDEEG